MSKKISKTLFIFGAGASRAEGAPTQDELIIEIFRIMEDIKKIKRKRKINYDELYCCYNFYKNKSIIKNLYKFTENFLDKLYPVNLNDQEVYFPSFEEIMGLIYFAKSRDETFKGIPQYELNNYFKIIITLISLILYEKLNITSGVNYRFIEYLFRALYKFKGFHNQISFLNTNYDILLDNALYKSISNYNSAFNPNRELKINYCFERFPSCINIKLFKPHGSLNWLICKSCGKIKYEFFKKISISQLHESIRKQYYPILRIKGNKNECDKCRIPYTPLIITPTFFKEFNNKIIKIILMNLEKELEKINNLVFIGYSFPDADIHLKYIFKKAQLFNGYNKIILVNKYSKNNNTYLYNIKRSFPGVDLINLTNLFKEGLSISNAKNIASEIIENIKQ
ncbi:MAG: hypothetical protein ACP6IY_19035 [Promethearchaeia archaeon]